MAAKEVLGLGPLKASGVPAQMTPIRQHIAIDGKVWRVVLHYAEIEGRQVPVGVEAWSGPWSYDRPNEVNGVHSELAPGGRLAMPVGTWPSWERVTSSTLRRINVGRLIANAAAHWTQPTNDLGTTEEAAQQLRQQAAQFGAAHGGRPATYTAKHFREVANVYEKACPPAEEPECCRARALREEARA